MDTVFYKRFGGDGYECFVRRKVKFPITYAKATLNLPKSVVKSIVSSEMLRYRRICSNGDFVQLNDDCLIEELVSRGYDERYIRRLAAARRYEICENYDENYNRKKKGLACEGLVYGSKSVYDGIWYTHRKLACILLQALPDGIRQVCL